MVEAAGIVCGMDVVGAGGDLFHECSGVCRGIVYGSDGRLV